MLSSPNLHWRYQLLGSCCLLFMVPSLIEIASREKNIGNSQLQSTLEWFLSMLSSGLPLLRALSIRAMTILLRSVRKLVPYKEIIHQCDPDRLRQLLEDSEGISSEQTCDKNYFGWNGPMKLCFFVPMVSTSSTPMNSSHWSDILWQRLWNDEKALKQFLSLIVHDHEQKKELQNTAVENNSGPSWIQSLLSKFIGGSNHLPKPLVGEEPSTGALFELLKSSAKTWPYTRTPLPKNVCFSVDMANFWKVLFQVCGGLKLFLVLKPRLELLLQSDRVGEQAVLGEILSALIRSSKYWLVEESSAMWHEVIPFLEKALATASSDNIAEWSVALRFAVYNRDIKRIQPLADLVLLAPLRIADSQTSTILVKRLMFINSFLSELTWRAPKQNLNLLQELPITSIIRLDKFVKLLQNYSLRYS